MRAQTPGLLDTSFESGSFVNGTIYGVRPIGDGKVYISGDFTTVRGAMRNGIARLNGDGTVDGTFDPGIGANGRVHAMAMQVDGKLLISGFFTSYNGTGRNRIARLNSDGSLDTSFSPSSGAGSEVLSIAVQPDGKILIGGAFTSFNGTTRNRIARLNSDGSLDISFNPGTGTSDRVRSVAVQTDGKILIGGDFTSLNGTIRNRVARLNSDGSLDTSFDPGSGADHWVYSVALQTDGQVLIGGFFTGYNGTARNRIARLNNDGSLDSSFNPGSGVTGVTESTGNVISVAVQTNGKILIGGLFNNYSGIPRDYIARLKSDGSLDESFSPGTGTNSSVNTVAVHADGKVLIGGDFTKYNGTTRRGLARLNGDGSLDTSFEPGAGANGGVNSAAVQADGKILIGGAFTSFNGTTRNRIARLNIDGSLDTSFDPGTGATSGVDCIVVQRDGRVVIAGDFDGYNGTSRNGIARLNNDGSLDTSFDPGTGAEWYVNAVAAQPDGKILIGGGFSIYNGVARNRIARINVDGSLDSTFDPAGTGPNAGIECIAIQTDGKVLIGGWFTNYSGAARNRVARLNIDGSLDTSFNPGAGANSVVYSLTIQVDGKVLIAGSFTGYNGTGRNRIARLNADGSLDTSFNTGGVTSSRVNSITVQTDGKVVIGVARLNSDGSLDTSFNPGTGAIGGINAVAIQPNGKILIGGVFTSYNGTACSYMTRLLNGPASQLLNAINSSHVAWTRSGAGPELEQVSFEHSADGNGWTFLGIATRSGSVWELTGLSLSGSGQLRARGRVVGADNSGIVEQVVNYAVAPLTPHQSWRQQYFGSIDNSGDGADLSDFDNDGVLNLIEFATGNNPLQADGQPARAIRNGSMFEFPYFRTHAAMNSGVTFAVEWSDSMSALTWSGFGVVEAVVSDDGTKQQVTAGVPIGGEGRRFVRLRVSVP